MRSTMHLSLPPPLKKWVEAQIEECGFATASEYIRQLLREEQKRRARLAVEARLDEAIASGDAAPVTADMWKETDKRVENHLRARRTRRRSHGANP
jgi:antitoxin ParD1/3/4